MSSGIAPSSTRSRRSAPSPAARRASGSGPAARFGDAWFTYFVSPRRFTGSLEKIASQRAGLTPFGAGLVMYVALAASREEARAAARAYLSNEYHQSFDGLVDRFCALGTP